MLRQILLTSPIRNVWRSVMRIYIFISELKGLKFLRHILNQSEVKQKTILSLWHAFSPVWRPSQVFALRSDWFIG